MREHLKAVAVAAASFVVVTGSIVSIGMATAEPASARMMGVEAGRRVALAWPQDAGTSLPFAAAKPVEVAALR